MYDIFWSSKHSKCVHTYGKFTGFTGCEIKRFFYIPPFITNTVIYK